MENSFWQYSFPPFFTLQLNSDTRRKQIGAWCDLVLSYCKAKKLYVLDVNEASTSPLFSNPQIRRKLSLESILVILDTLESRGNVEWQDKIKSRCIIMWRSPQEWGQEILHWASNQGLDSSVCTFYEILHGEDSSEEEFHGMESWLLKRAVQSLEKDGKAELIISLTGDDSDCGVKFFS